MLLKQNDLHVMLSRTARRCQVYTADGSKVLDCDCRNRTVNDLASPSERFAPCPPGEYILGAPVAKNTPPFGPWFILLSDYGPHHAMAANGRAAIGLHGGGSGLTTWDAANQGVYVCTLGCWRFLNVNLERLVILVRAAQAAGGSVYSTVAPFTAGLPGAAPFDSGEPDLMVSAALLAEGE